MRGVLFVMAVAVIGSSALIIRNNRSPKRVYRQASITPPTTDCVCVEYNQCNTNYTVNKYGVTLIDLRNKGPCEHYLQVCCRKDDQIIVGGPGSTPQPSVNPSPDPSITNSSSSDLISTDSPSPTPSSTDSPSPNPITSPSPTDSSPSPSPSTPSIPATSLPSTNTPSSTNSPLNPSTSSPSIDDPDSVMTPPKVITEDHYQSRGCGFRNQDGVGFRIFGGKLEAQFGEFPWVVAILQDDGKFICGGSLIHPKVVLTGAHCVSGKSTRRLVARAGEWDIGTTREVLPHQDRSVSEVIEHEHYHSGAVLNNVALLILTEPMKLADNVDIICLPTQDFNFDNAQCVASGWGKDDFNSKKEQVIIRKVDLPIVPRDACQSSLRTTRLGRYFQLHDSFLCAGGKEGQDTCTGDGGGPLMCPLKDDPQRYEQAGIVAWGIGCGNVIPGVYVSVARFRHWITSELGERDITIDDDAKIDGINDFSR